MRFGIHVGHLGGPLDELRRLWRFADERGFDWFSVSDHFQETPGQGGGEPCLESVATLAAAAADTRRVEIGCLVFCVAFRHPALLAKSVTAIDHVSGGRVACGLGAGWHEPEFRAYGIPFEPARIREDRLEEYARAVRLLFDEPYASFHGAHYTLEHAPNFPRPQRRVPLWIGGAGEKRTLRIAARHADAWNAPYLSPEQWRAKNTVLDRWCESERRDPRSIARTVNVGFYIGADAAGTRRGEERYQREWGRDERGWTGFLRGTAADAQGLIERFAGAGAAQVNIAVRAGPYDWDALEAFASAVMPPFRTPVAGPS